jgi:glycosyltransferase involved in cell wall biosynthesis
MIVKNEAHIIRETLDSVVPYISYWVVCDTGSTDGTQDLIRSYFKEKNIPGELIDRPWVSFGHNRTEVFDYAVGKADYIWVIDADDLLVGQFPNVQLTHDAYDLKYKSPSIVYTRRQLFKNNLHWKYVGVLHEYAESPLLNTEAELQGDYSIDSRRLGSRSLDPNKYLNDAHLLEQGLIDEPNNSRYMFYLGQSYFDARQYEPALEAYNRRILAGGWDEEVFYALYRAGQCLINLKRPADQIIEKLLRAYHVRPTRGESLYLLLRYCRETNNFYLGYMIGKFSQNIPFPTQDKLFVEPDVYRYKILDEFSICAYWVGKYQESLNACTKVLLESDLPDRSRIEQNLQYAKQKLS